MNVEKQLHNYSPFSISVGYKQILPILYDNTGNLMLMAGGITIILLVVAYTKSPLKYRICYSGNE